MRAEHSHPETIPCRPGCSGWNESIWLVEETTFESDTDLGYFATLEDAQTLCNRLNAEQELRYHAEVERILLRNNEIVRRNAAKLEDWKAQVAASDGPLSPPWLDRLAPVLAYEDWRHTNETKYAPVEVKLAQPEDPEPDRPGDCDRCGMSYDDCTERIHSGRSACCQSCRVTAHHPGMHAWETWERSQRVNR